MYAHKFNYFLWILLCALGGCNNPVKENSWDLDESLDSSNNPQEIYDSNDPLSNTGLPDLQSEMNPEFCKTAWGNTPNVAGAVSYFSGIYLRREDSDGWTGQETWTLFPNSSWTDSFSQCIVTWRTSGQSIEPNLCAACTEALEVFAEIDLSKTTCPEAVWNFPEELSWSTKYDLLLSNSEARFFYYSSGDLIGTGDSNTYAASFLSDPHCVWF